MKKLLLAIALVITISLSVSAQSDGFFKDGGSSDNYNRTGSDPTLPGLPGYGVGATNNDQTANAPLGSGLIILTALGAGYAVKRVKSRE